MLSFSFQAEGLDEILRVLDQTKDRAENSREEFFRFVGDEFMLASILRNFSAEGRPNPWAQLAPSTVRERERLGVPGPHPILYRFGDMYAAMGNQVEITPDSIFVGTDSAIAGYHQMGGPNLPQRIIFIWQEEDIQNIMDFAGKFFVDEVWR